MGTNDEDARQERRLGRLVVGWSLVVLLSGWLSQECWNAIVRRNDRLQTQRIEAIKAARAARTSDDLPRIRAIDAARRKAPKSKPVTTRMILVEYARFHEGEGRMPRLEQLEKLLEEMRAEGLVITAADGGYALSAEGKKRLVRAKRPAQKGAARRAKNN